MKGDIRKAEKKDSLVISALMKEGDDFHARLLPSHFRVSEGGREKDDIQRLLDTEDSLLLLCENANIPIGFLYARFSNTVALPFILPKKVMIIESIVVTESERENGIGSRLLREAEDWAVKRKVERISLNVFSRNRAAIALYGKMGYEAMSVKMEKEIGTGSGASSRFLP